MDKLLQVKNLTIAFDTPAGRFAAVDDVSFAVSPGKTLCIVGESGSGKSVTSLGIMRLLQTPPGHYAGGQILFEDEDILTRSEAEMRRIRGSKISMIFQEPMSSLNPVLTIGYQIMESIRVHQHIGKCLQGKRRSKCSVWWASLIPKSV